MKRSSILFGLAALAFAATGAAAAPSSEAEKLPIHLVASQSSNSSSNSSNGLTTRVDTYTSTDDRGRRVYQRRVYRERIDRPPYRGYRRVERAPRWIYRERAERAYPMRRSWRGDDDD